MFYTFGFRLSFHLQSSADENKKKKNHALKQASGGWPRPLGGPISCAPWSDAQLRPGHVDADAPGASSPLERWAAAAELGTFSGGPEQVLLSWRSRRATVDVSAVCLCGGAGRARVGPAGCGEAAGVPRGRAIPGLRGLRSAAFIRMGERPAHLSVRPAGRLISDGWEVAVAFTRFKERPREEQQSKCKRTRTNVGFCWFQLTLKTLNII